jgi:hypothetical protein
MITREIYQIVFNLIFDYLHEQFYNLDSHFQQADFNQIYFFLKIILFNEKSQCLFFSELAKHYSTS